MPTLTSRPGLALSSALFAVAVAACGGPTESVPDAKSGSNTDAAPADAKIDTGTFVSNTPGATVVDAGSPATPNVVLLSSNLLQHPSGNQVFRQWVGEIKNAGSTTICQISIDVSFKNATGGELATFRTYASADPYMFGSSTLSMGCLAPGAVGGFYTNAFAPADAPLADVKTIAVKFGPHEYPGAIPAPHAPTVSAHVTTVFSTKFGLEGALTGNSAPIWNIGVDFFPRDARGLVLDRLGATDLDTLYPGGTFSFTTVGVDTSFTEFRGYAEFIDGVKTAAALVASPNASPLERTAASLELLRRQDRADAAARAAASR